MANEVFANDLEIACKAADGKSVACFPDPCFSPPSPSAGWILIPYANTAYAKDTTNASKTVFISGKPIMKKDVSYFKTSTGNEPAAGPKGQFTGVKKGKAYFTCWSMNVKVEGENVCRHTDGMTHNHGSKSGNTGIWKYWDSGWFSDPCKKEFKRVEKKCGGMEKKNKKKGNGIFDNNWKKVKNRGGDWKRKHCKFHNKTPSSPSKALEEFKEEIKNIPSVEDFLNNALNEATDFAIQIINEKIIKFGVKAVAKKVLLGATGIGIAIAIADAALDAIELKKLMDMKNAINSELARVQEKLSGIKNKIENASELSQREVADLQDALAVVDPCLRARKCMLVEFKTADSQAKKDVNKSKNMDHNGGCCPGQTGHHLMQDSYFTKTGIRGSKKAGVCPGGYNIDKAPVVCVEGSGNQSGGSHQRIHTNSDGAAATVKDNFTYENARDASVKALQKTYPLSLCSKKCIRSQLDKYYKDKGKCHKGDKLNAINKTGKPLSNNTLPNQGFSG